MRLKRSKTSVGDLVGIDDDLRSASQSSAQDKAKAPQRARPQRGFSLAELTKRIGLHRTPQKSIDKATISRPIADPRFPIVVSSPALTLGLVSPPSSIFAQTPPGSNPNSIRSNHAVNSRPSVTKLELGASNKNLPPLQIPATIPWAARELVDSPLQDIPESPPELQVEKAIKLLTRTRKSTPEPEDKMDPTRLSVQPPAAGTKSRAIQQAKDMEEIVAERAKRSGEEAPPYDFYELIGKGAYGRVFKG